MSVTVMTMDQRSEAWHQARLGRLTGSRAAEMMAPPARGAKESVQRRDLRIALALERLTGVSDEDGYVSREMQRGIDKEKDARAYYEAITCRIVRQSGFLSHDSLMVGCSLDGYVGNIDGLIECKCPKSANHLEFLRTGEIPTKYRWQLIHNMWVSGAFWADYVSFDDRFSGQVSSLQFAVVTLKRENVDMRAYELAVRMFLAEVDKEVQTLTDMSAARTAAA